MLKVLKPGFKTTVQDAGRFGYHKIGVPPSGCMDPFSYEVANILVGNMCGEAVLEITYLGPELEFQKDALIAITGADMPPKIDGKDVPAWTALQVKAGSKLSFGFVKKGARAYLAVRGGIDVPFLLGSRSCLLYASFGGYKGRALLAGDILEIGETADAKFVKPDASVPESMIPVFEKHHELRAVTGIYSYRIQPDSLKAFYDTEWTVSTEADRMAVRLIGIPIKFVDRPQPFGAGNDPSNVVDGIYPTNAINLNTTEAMIMSLDGVSGGGYTTITTIISADYIHIGQAKSNDKMRFVPISLEEALKARQEQRALLNKIKEHVQAPSAAVVR